MHLRAYLDRSGYQRFGVVVDGRLLTAGQLDRKGGLGPQAEAAISDLVVLETDWRDVGRAARRAVRKGASLIDPGRDRRPRRSTSCGPEDRLRRAQLRRPCRRGRARRPVEPAAVRQVPQRDRRRRRRHRPPRGHPRARPRGGARRRDRAPCPARDPRAGDGPRRRLRRRQRHQRPRLAGQPAGPPRGREGRRPVAPRQGQRHLPAHRPRLRDPGRARPARRPPPPQLADPRQGQGQGQAAADAGRHHEGPHPRRARAGELHLAPHHPRARRPHRHRHARRAWACSATRPCSWSPATACGARSRASARWRIRSSTGPRTRVPPRRASAAGAHARRHRCSRW